MHFVLYSIAYVLMKQVKNFVVNMNPNLKKRKERPMTNGEKFKTAEERGKAFENHCNSQKSGCNKCILNKYAGDMCRFAWLELEYKEELKPCPFCGGESELGKDENLYYVRCQECLTETKVYDNDYEAIAAWNRRAK
jgi:Lar family restriction alleviation protein